MKEMSEESSSVADTSIYVTRARREACPDTPQGIPDKRQLNDGFIDPLRLPSECRRQ